MGAACSSFLRHQPMWMLHPEGMSSPSSEVAPAHGEPRAVLLGSILCKACAGEKLGDSTGAHLGNEGRKGGGIQMEFDTLWDLWEEDGHCWAMQHRAGA